MFSKRTSKDDLLRAIKDLEEKVEQGELSIGSLITENGYLQSEIEELRLTVEQKDKRIAILDEAVSGMKKELRDAKNQASEYKSDLDRLKDTKAILADLKSQLSAPVNALNSRIAQLENDLQVERNRSADLECELRNAKMDTQAIQYLEGKVCAYESMLKDQRLAVRSVRAYSDSAKATESTVPISES